MLQSSRWHVLWGGHCSRNCRRLHLKLHFFQQPNWQAVHCTASSANDQILKQDLRSTPFPNLSRHMLTEHTELDMLMEMLRQMLCSYSATFVLDRVALSLLHSACLPQSMMIVSLEYLKTLQIRWELSFPSGAEDLIFVMAATINRCTKGLRQVQVLPF